MNDEWLSLVDLAAERFGASVVAANDEFFGARDRLIIEHAPVWIEDRYTERGKWMDGWETRRRRDAGHDWCIVRLGAPGIVRGVNVDTTHFKGNFPESCAVDLVDLPGVPPVDELASARWTEALPRCTLTGHGHNLFTIERGERATHLRLRIFPDGGVARLRVYGEAAPDWDRLKRRGQVDLGAAEHGGRVVACSDMFFGSRHNLIMPGEARTMGEGWETKRRRGEGHDWAVVRLGAPGTIERIEVDTRHFKGNAPGACSLDACTSEAVDPTGAETSWRMLVARTRLQPDARHVFEDDMLSSAQATHVRLSIFPDGGVARLRLFGRPA